MIEMKKEGWVKLVRAKVDGSKESYEIAKDVAIWLNDKLHMKYSEQRHKDHSPPSVIRYRESFDQVNNLLWDIRYDNIHHVAHNRFIGTLSAYIDEPNKRAEMGILIAPGFRGHGNGTEAWRLAMRYLETRVDVIEAGMMFGNTGMRKICERCGMEPAGFILDHFIYEGQREGCFFYRWKRSRQ